MNLRKTLTLIATAATFAFATNLAAQDHQMQQQPPAPPQTVEVSDQQLEQFADAQIQITEIQQDFAGRLQEVDDPEQAHELQVQANEEMTEAVQEIGLSVQDFNEIAMAIQNDPELQQRLTALLQDRS
ncbi:MAG: DUF4168 domain-containing protein [Wenzhouxiangella sp.]